MTHVTIAGLLVCAVGYARAGELLRLGDRDLMACDPSRRATYVFTHPKRKRRSLSIWAMKAPFEIPTCPRCAVLRDEALSGVMPEGYR